MLRQPLIDTARRSISVALADRREAAAKGLARIYESGSLRSSRTMVVVGDLIADEFMVRAQIAWQALLRALATQPDVVTTELKATLLAEIGRVLNAESQDMAGLVEDARLKSNATGDWEPFIAKRRQRALDWAESEIEFALLEATSKHAKGPDRATFNFYGTVGAVLAGPGASASISITTEQRQSVITAVNAVKQAVATSTDLAPQQREQLVELAEDAAAEVEKNQPNTHRLRGTLSGLAMGIQTLGAAREAYHLLKAASSLIGLHLP